MKKLSAVLLFIVIVLTNNIFGQQHMLFTELLTKYVKSSLVDYKNLMSDKRLAVYLEQLSKTNPDKLNRNEKLAFWINVYNAFTLKVIIDNYPLESINELHTGGRIIGHLLGKTVWDKEFIIINKEVYSLNDIEHKILRKMKEPRIHFAIVCASISCPPLRDEAYEASKINEQLQSQASEFMNDENRNSFNLKNRDAQISKIFDWFEEDFGESEEEVLTYISQYLSDNIRLDIKSNSSKWKISSKDYDWNLNEIK